MDSETNEVKAYFKNPGVKIDNKLKSTISKIIDEKNVLLIAQAYSKVDKIYFPLRLDFRTKMNCETVYFDYQKTDLAKG